MISEAYLMDCMEYMATIPDKWFDLAVTDPPYGIGINGKVGGGKCAKVKVYKNKGWDTKPPTPEYFTELKRISKNQIIWGGNYFLFSLNETPCFLIWDKDNTGNFADAELAWTSFDTATRIFKFRWNGMLQKNMKDKEIRIHETQKPISLYQWIYANYLPQGGKVIDTHLGSGSNRIAADKAGNIDFYATEIDADYFNAQEKRWREYKAQAVITFPDRIDPAQSALF